MILTYLGSCPTTMNYRCKYMNPSFFYVWWMYVNQFRGRVRRTFTILGKKIVINCWLRKEKQAICHYNHIVFILWKRFFILFYLVDILWKRWLREIRLLYELVFLYQKKNDHKDKLCFFYFVYIFYSQILVFSLQKLTRNEITDTYIMIHSASNFCAINIYSLKLEFGKNEIIKIYIWWERES